MHIGSFLGKIIVACILSVSIGCAAIQYIWGLGSEGYMQKPSPEVCGEPLESTITLAAGQGMAEWVGASRFFNAADRRESQEEHKEKERCDLLIAIDPGHGGTDEGCSRSDVYEKDINLQIALAVEAQLRELGYQVMLTRDEDTEVALEKRAAMANEAAADMYISIHQNACEETASGVCGIEVWYNSNKSEAGSRRLARLLQDNLSLYTAAKERELVADNSLYVLRETDMPACLIETGFLSNREERKLLTSQEYQSRLAEAIVSGIDLYFYPKTMYLTFDDGPSAENTMEVLDILKAHGIKATFFLIGENVEKHPEVAKRIAEEGHTIGIHCYRHDYESLYADSASYVEDFNRAKEVVYEVTGVEAKLFRFPGGSINSYNKNTYEEIIQTMTELGYIYFDWNASLEDATKHNEPERLLKNAKESTFGRKKVVMLAHDVISNTVSCLEELLEQFPEYRMLPLTDQVEPIQF
ncbi:MAG: N-acetylmuramoyl-L-alanine amidase [Roseburia sp.]|nr:N-acetylmuramoyl-L-alanine amidase [Roseburia sp.]